MSLTPRDKQEKDRALVRREIQKNPEIFKQVLARVYGPDGGEAGKARAFEQFAYLRKRAKHLDQAMVAKLVGEGFIRPLADNKSKRYTITQKGRAAIGPKARLAKASQPVTKRVEHEQSADNMLRQAEDDMGLPPGTLDDCMGGSD